MKAPDVNLLNMKATMKPAALTTITRRPSAICTGKTGDDTMNTLTKLVLGALDKMNEQGCYQNRWMSMHRIPPVPLWLVDWFFERHRKPAPPAAAKGSGNKADDDYEEIPF